jgi:tetratricopeptide (TPR) repeat protein
MNTDLLIGISIIAVYLAVVLMPAAKICERVGYPKWFSFVMLVPGLNIIAYWVFAFSPWPILRREPEMDDHWNDVILESAGDRAADIYWRHGEHYREQGDSEQRQARINRSANKVNWPWRSFKKVRAHYDQAIEYYKKAIDDYNVAIKLDPDRYRYYLDRVNAYLSVGDRGNGNADLSGAINRLTEKINANPSDYELRVARGSAYHGLGDLKPAFADLNEAIRLEPELALAYLWRGRCFEDNGDYDNAEADFNRAVELIPNYIRTKDPRIGNLIQRHIYIARWRFFMRLCDKYDYRTAEYREYKTKWGADEERVEEIRKEFTEHDARVKMKHQSVPAPA